MSYCIGGHEIYRRVSPRADFEQKLGTGAQAFRNLSAAHDEVDTELARIVKSLGTAWKGKAAEAAKAEMTKLQEVSAKVATTNMQPAQYSYDDESASHERLRNSLTPVDEEPEDASFFSILPGVDSQEQKNEQWEEANANNVRKYTDFEQRTFHNQRLMNEPFPEVKINDDVNSGDKGRTGAIDGGGATGPSASGSAATPTSPAGYSGGAYGGGGYGTSGPQVGSPAGAGGYYGGTGPAGSGAGVTSPSSSGPYTGLPPGAERLPDGSIRYPDGTIRTPDGRLIRPGSTTTSGFGSGRSGSGAEGGYGPGGMAGGAVAGGGAAAGSAAGMGGQPLGGGKAAGAMPSQGMAPGGMAAKGAAGFGPGRGGMGGMMGGGGAGRGQGGDEDGEHQDKYYIKQEMDPGLHVEYDEHGEKLVDESTGFTVVPPVIGE
ncbi:MAG: hypothetical protein GEU97_21855 [Actinophytocola sp.]|nr:hypothetical protein [Actinophytocola sp.]